MDTGKYLTLGEAAKETGVQKSTLSKALKSGKLSFIDKTSAGYKIDPSELFRVYPRKPQDTVSTTVSNERLDTPKYSLENNPLQATVDAQEKLMLRLEAEIDDLKVQRDEWMGQAKTLLISNQSTPPDSQKSPRGGLFGFLWGNG